MSTNRAEQTATALAGKRLFKGDSSEDVWAQAFAVYGSKDETLETFIWRWSNLKGVEPVQRTKREDGKPVGYFYILGIG